MRGRAVIGTRGPIRLMRCSIKEGDKSKTSLVACKLSGVSSISGVGTVTWLCSKSVAIHLTIPQLCGLL